MKKHIGIIALCTVIVLTGACGLFSDAPEPSAAPTASPTPTPTPSPEPTPSPTELPPMLTTEPEPTMTFAGQVICTASEFVNIREKADVFTDIVGTFPAGAVANVIEYQDGWAYIVYDRTVGYISLDYAINKRTPEGPVPMGDWAAILVSPTHILPEGFAVTLAAFENSQVDARILDIATQMFADAAEDSVTFQLVDAYRSRERQSELFEQMVRRYTSRGYSREKAEAEAATITARPDTSEHQTGLALDIVTPSYTKMNSGFAKTAAFKWLHANAQFYGFTMRYKPDKKDITGVIYESWHWRFVGVKAAIAMKQSGECFEEYLGELD